MNHIRLLCWLILGLFLTNTVNGQLIITKSELKEPVVNLLLDYQRKLANIKPNLRPDPSRELISLFSIQYAKVVNNLSKNPVNPEISIRNYCANLKDLFPDGVTISFNASSIRFGRFQHDFGDQYLIPVRLFMVLNAFPGGVVYENKQIVEVMISFKWDGENASLFRIVQIQYPEYSQQEIGINILSGGSEIAAQWIDNEDRINQPLSFSGGFGVNYKYWIKPGFGIGSGMEMILYQSHVELDKLNAFVEKDPHLSDIKFNTSLYQINWPLTAYFKTQTSERISWYTNVGLILSYRFWEEFESSAIQTQLNREITDIISDSNWESGLSSIFFGAELDAGINIKLSKRIIVQTGISLMTGLNPIDKNSDKDFSINKFAGQYNPLWMDPDTRNFVRFAGLSFGFSYILGNKDTN